MARKTFKLDRRNGKLLGVCAGIAEYTGWDATLIRIGAVVVTLLGAFPWTLIAYGALAYVGRPKKAGRFAGIDRARTSRRGLNANLDEIDRRMAAIDSYVAGSNGRLAREIEELR